MNNQTINIHTIIKDNIKIAIKEEIEKHQKLGHSIVVSKDGKPLVLTPEKILSEINTSNPE